MLTQVLSIPGLTELLEGFLIVGGVLLFTFAAPAICLFFLIRRKRRERALRRSPLGIKLLRSPGQSLRDQLDEAESEFTWDVASLMLTPAMLLAMILALQLASFPTGVAYLSAGLFFVAFVARQTRKMLAARKHADHLKAGYDAELAVGQQLDQLMLQQARVFHDVAGDSFNIDHVVVHTKGLFAIETKGFTKTGPRSKASATVSREPGRLRFPTFTTSEPLDQAERQAKWLSEWMTKAVGAPVRAIPVLALPGWFVDGPSEGTIRVYSGKQLEWLLKPQAPELLSGQEVQRIAHQLEQRCRDVSPTYSS